MKTHSREARLVSFLSGLLVALGGLGAALSPVLAGNGSPSPQPSAGLSQCVSLAMRDAVSPVAPVGVRRQMLSQALRKGFGVQYWGAGYDAAKLGAAPHGVLIVEAAKVGAPHTNSGREATFSRDEVKMMSRAGQRPVLAYLNVSEIETYRDYWVLADGDGTPRKVADREKWLGPRMAGDGQLALFWTPEWEEVLGRRVDALMDLGFDGLFLDDVLHYYDFAADKTLDWTGVSTVGRPRDATEYAAAMMRLVERLSARSRAKSCNAIIMVNNGVYIARDAAGGAGIDAAKRQFAGYLDAIDAILVEDLFASPAREATISALSEDFAANGTEVLSIDFGARFPGRDVSDVRRDILRWSSELGFASYLADDGAFDRLYPPIIPSDRVASPK